MNYMSKIADMLGVELGEKFKLKVRDTGEEYPGIFWIDEQGLWLNSEGNPDYLLKSGWSTLLTGIEEIVKLPWKPSDGDKVFFTTPAGDIGNKPFNSEKPLDLLLYKNDMLYQSFSEANQHADEDYAFWGEILPSMNIGPKKKSNDNECENTGMIQLDTQQKDKDFNASGACVGAKDFRTRVVDKLKSVMPDLNKDDLYFYQYRNGYDIAYAPNYPYKTDKDFLVHANWDGEVFVHNNTNTTHPVVTQYTCLGHFEKNFTF